MKMRDVFLAWAALVIVATHANSLSKPAFPISKWIDSGRKCSCSGRLFTGRTLNCTNRGRTTLAHKELCWRTKVVDLSYNHFESLPEHWGSSIKKVNVSHNLLTAIPRAPPLNLKTTSLDLSNNKIVNASHHELRFLSSLEYLAVSNNQLRTLSFLPSPCALRILSAHHSALSSFQGSLNSCSKMEYLDLSFNHLNVLRRGSFSGLHKLKKLLLNGVNMFHIDSGAFEGLNHLQYLDLSDNDLIMLPAGGLSLLELKQLFLDRNYIYSLAASAFHGLRSVEIISLTRNNLTKLKGGLFAGLYNLKNILLDANKISYLPFGLFSGLHKVEHIGLSSNELTEMPPSIFAGLHKLKSIRLSDNKLTSVPLDLLLGISNLQELDLSNNFLTYLPDNMFHGVRSIKKLELSGNFFTELLNINFIGLQSIGRLDIRDNQISSLPQRHRTWPKMNKIFMGGNNITKLSEPVLESWLGDLGKKESRLLDLGQKPPLSQQSPKSWRSVLGDPTVVAGAIKDNCACGYVRRGRGEVMFCINVSCPDISRSWIEAARTLRLSNTVSKPEPPAKTESSYGWIGRWTNWHIKGNSPTVY